MTTDELKKLAEAATPIYTALYGDSYFRGPFSYAALSKEQDAYIEAANPAAILKLLAINAELVEALKGFVENQMTVGQRYTNEGQAMLDALAKAERGEL